MIQVSGLAFAYAAERPFKARVLKASASGKMLDPKARYRVATNSLLAQGGHSYKTFLAIPGKADLGSQFEMIKTWLRRHPEITAPPLGRIQRHIDDSNARSHENRH